MSLLPRDVIRRAMRMTGRVASNTDPTADEMADAFLALNTMKRALFGTLIGPRLSAQSATGSAAQAETGGEYAIPATSFTLTAPAFPRGGDRFGVADAALNFAVDPCTVARNGALLNGAAANLVLSPANSFINLDQQTNYNSYPFNLTWGYFNFNNQGAAGNSSLLSGSATAQNYLEIGRTGLDLMLGVAAAANGLVSGTAAGDAVVGSWGAASSLFLVGGQNVAAKATASGFDTYGTGAAQFGTFVLQPATDTDCLVVKTHGGTLHFDVNTSTGVTSFNNGIMAIGYSDAGTTQTFILRANSGAIQAGAAVYPGAPAASPAVQTAAGIWAGSGAPNNAYGSNGDYYFRSDTPGTANQRIYVKNAGAWTGMV